MARSTIDEDITRLEAELSALRVKISNQEHLKEMEEGGAGSRFRSAFSSNESLYERERNLVNRLELLYSYKARI